MAAVSPFSTDAMSLAADSDEPGVIRLNANRGGQEHLAALFLLLHGGGRREKGDERWKSVRSQIGFPASAP
jgi:hypothetical protein